MSALAANLDAARSPHGLSAEDARAAFDAMMDGAASHEDMAAFLLALRERGETAAEILGAAQALRARMLPVAAPDGAIDIVGTGGDARGTYNVSTCAAFVAAGAGAKVAKHGNRAVSSKSGSADVLEALGVNLGGGPEKAALAVREAGVGFLFAPAHHAAMRHVAPVRKALGVRTIFNLLGPLCNPANVKRMVLGVYAPEWLRPIAAVTRELGAEHVWVVHGAGGLDELSTLGPSHVAEMRRDADVRLFSIACTDAGVASADLQHLVGGGPQENAAAIRDVLDGRPSAFRDIVILNAAAALVVAGQAEDVRRGAALAASSIDGGAARAALAKLVEISNS
ncbi:MAG: anthranilate phosphoribosyltransferase [Hyphomicrobiales bacterium]|nr:anthranilate phosphoribosyltransferase [Hyphomicrobiales bacterium]